MPRPSAGGRDAIIDAAIVEFSESGFDGTRMERVAARAGFNKSLAYRYFKDKLGLFRAALKRKFTQRSGLLDRIPERLGDILVYWTTQTSADPHFMRLIQREALNDDGGTAVAEDYRTAYYQRQIELLASFQQQGKVEHTLEARFLFLALLAVVVFPGAFPQITRLATGMSEDSPEFERGWSEFLQRFADQLGVGATARS